MNSVTMKVAEQITAIAPQVEDKVVTTLVTRELDRRSNAMVQVLDKLDQEEKAFRKLKPDQASYDDKGAQISTWYSKSKKEEREKLEKRINKMKAALNKALDKSEFGDVFNFASGKEVKDDTGTDASNDSNEDS